MEIDARGGPGGEHAEPLYAASHGPGGDQLWTYLFNGPFESLEAFAADALNDSKPEVALKFVNRGLSLLPTQDATDFHLYQNLVELRVQILLVLDRTAEALVGLEEAREMLPNNPTIAKWIARLQKK